MNLDVVPSVIRRRLQDGRLPHGSITNVVEVPGDGQLCDACGAIITSDQMAMEGAAQESGQRTIQLHALCYRIWDNERHLLDRHTQALWQVRLTGHVAGGARGGR